MDTLKSTFGGGQLIVVYISAYGSTQSTSQCLEDGLGLMVLVVALGLYVEVHQGCVAQALEEMEEHFRRHITDIFSMELRFPDKPGTAREVERDVGVTIVHRQREAVALNAALGAESLADALA